MRSASTTPAPPPPPAADPPPGSGAAPDSPPLPTFVVQPRPGWRPLDLAELWRYRDLLWILAVRDLKVRYRQTALGAAWAVLQPVLAMAVFAVFFGRLAGVPSDGLPYPLFVYCGLLPWQLFAYVLTESGNSLANHERLLGKVWFPRILIPMSTVLTGLVDFAVAATVLVALMAWFGHAPGASAWALPALVALAAASALALGIWLAALNVQFRDVKYALPFVVQIGLLATPVAYPASLVPERWRLLLALNPMAGVVEGCRWALLGSGAPPGGMLAVSAAATAAVGVAGLYYFRRMERTFADLV